MNNAVLNTARLGVARLNCANLGDFMGSGSGSGASLPKEYQQVEYIEGTGTQYIKTAIKTSLTLDFVCEFSKSNSDITFLFGGRTNQSLNGVLFGFNGSNCNVAYGKQTNMYSVTKNVIDGNKHIVELSDSVYTIDGEEQYIANRGNTLSDTYYVYLFALNNNGTTNTRMYIGRVFSFLIKEFDVAQCYFIPCYRKADGEVGMYDIINDVFYTNQGTGTFLKGADVNDKTYSKPYIKGHITTADSSFTFSVDGKQKSVPVDGNGDFKLKLNNPITSLSFVGVPQLESLELFKIDGLTTFDVDYPTKVTYLRCDSTTKSAKNDVYHIRGTATESFSFSMNYIDLSGNNKTVTENAVIDENGNWDIPYSGKRIRSMSNYFSGIKVITTIEFTDDLSNCITFINGSNSGGVFKDTYLTKIKFAEGTSFNVGNIVSVFMNCSRLTEIINSESIVSDKTSVMGASGSYYGTFRGCSSLQTLDLSKSDFSNITRITEAFTGCSSLENFYPNINSPIGVNLTLRHCPLSYESMERCVNWLKDYSNGSYVIMGKQSQSQWNNKTIDWYILENDTYVVATTYSSTDIYYKLETQTITFNKSTYDDLTLEQKTTLEGIAAQKGWILATSN